jgi:ABC-2 type transport system ATP-binding protein
MVLGKRRQRLIDEVLELVSLEVRREAEINELSRGIRQRLCFAKSLLHEPLVLLLDEPASGLDPAGRVEFREMIKQLHPMGRTVLISSHILTAMTEFCTSIGILERGQLLTSGRVETIQQVLQPEIRLRIEVADQQESLAALLSQEPAAGKVIHSNRQFECAWRDDHDTLPALHRKIVDAKIPIISFSVEGDNLEDLYMRISRHHTA